MANALPWVRIDTALDESPKLDHLEALLGIDDALPIVVRLWTWVGKVKSYGILAGVLDATIAKRVRWRGDVDELMSALEQADILIGPERGRLVVGWWEHQRRFLRKRDQGKAVEAEGLFSSYEAEIRGLSPEDAARVPAVSPEDTLSVPPVEPDRSIDRSIPPNPPLGGPTDSASPHGASARPERRPEPDREPNPTRVSDLESLTIRDIAEGRANELDPEHPLVLAAVGRFTGTELAHKTRRLRRWRARCREAGGLQAGAQSLLGLQLSEWHSARQKRDVGDGLSCALEHRQLWLSSMRRRSATSTPEPFARAVTTTELPLEFFEWELDDSPIAGDAP